MTVLRVVPHPTTPEARAGFEGVITISELDLRAAFGRFSLLNDFRVWHLTDMSGRADDVRS